jgi:hypothetical protein
MPSEDKSNLSRNAQRALEFSQGTASKTNYGSLFTGNNLQGSVIERREELRRFVIAFNHLSSFARFLTSELLLPLPIDVRHP